MAAGAREAILADERKRFLEEELPAVAEKAALLGIKKEQILKTFNI